MASWSLEQRMFAYDCFVRNGESVTTVQREFHRRFNVHRNDSVPARDTILRWVNNLRTGGSIMKKKPPGPQRTVRTPENIEKVRQAMLERPDRSARKHSAALQINWRTLRRILHEDLHFHPYKLEMVQKLNARDYLQRLNFAQAMLALYEQDANMMVAMSDEAHFHLNGAVSKQNYRYWTAENPSRLHETLLHSPKVTVWCAVGKFGVIGPYFFEENGVTVTVTSARYIEMVNTFFIPELQRRCIDRQHLWFQQDGAMAHTTSASMAVMRSLFPNRLISRFGDVSWPPRSPDLSTCDFFLWGLLKSCVYETEHHTLDELKEAIRQQITKINGDLLESVENDFHKRLKHCIKENGHHMRDVIFRS